MLVQSTSLRAAPLWTEPLAEPKVAVLLNANARRVSDKVIHRISHVVPEEDLFVSRTFADARRIAQAVVERRYHTVFTGGGDGTFMAFANAVHEELLTQGVPRPPRFGVLKLGTGNALAGMVGASALRGEGVLDDILRARAGEVPSVRRLDLLTCGGRLAPFAGLGFDAAILNDYVDVKQRLGGMAGRLAAGGSGYFMAVALKTVPHYLAHPEPVQAEIVCEGEAVRVGPDGKPTHAYRAGDVLFRGGLNIVAASTIPFYGFRLKMFPFAGQRRGMMHLRASSVNAASCMANLGRLWKGKWFDPHIYDFLTDGATIRFERPMPLQVGGDAEGYRTEVRFGMAERTLDLVDFTAALN